MKRLFVVLLVLSFTSSIRANAIITSFTAQKVGDSVQFNWTANEDNMFYYEVMEVINVNGSEKLLIHTEVTNSGQTTGMAYQKSAAMSRVLMVGFPVILILLLLGALIGWNKTIRKLALVLVCIVAVNASCKKDTSNSGTTGDPDVPGQSSSTKGVFRLKSVDLNGNISYTGYIVLTY